MTTKSKYPYLSNLLSSRLHNMWPEEYGTWENALNDYCERSSLKRLEKIHSELKTLISEEHDEATLDDIVFNDLHANYYPPGDGFSYQQWLGKIYELTGSWLSQKPKEPN